MRRYFCVITLLLWMAAACGGGAATAVPAETAIPATDIPATQVAAATSTPTVTPTHTATAMPTATHTAAAPTETATAAPSPAATATKRASATPGVRASATPGGNRDTAGTGTAVPTRPAADATAASAAGDSPDAMTILQKSQEAQDKVHTLTQHQVTVLVSSGITQTQTHDCQRELPNNAYCQISIGTQLPGAANAITTTLEMVLLDGVYWVRETSDDAWEQLPEDLLQQMGMADQLAFEFSIDPIYVTRAEIIGEREIDGVPAYEIQAALDAELYFNDYFNEETAAQILENLDEASFVTTLWIGREDFITRKQVLTMILSTIEGETITTTAQVINNRIDEPVFIPDPTAD